MSLAVSQFLVHQLSGTGMVVKVTGDEGHVDVPALPDWLSVVQTFQNGEQAGVLLDESGEGIKVFGPTGSTKPFPSGLSPVGGIHGPVGVFFFGLAKGGEDLTVGGVFRLEGLPSFRLGDFSVDEQSEAVRLSGDPIEGGLGALGCFP